MPIPPNLELDTVRILISRVRDGDDSARSELASQVQGYLSIMAENNVEPQIRAKQGVSDVVQLTLIRMVDGIDQFRGESTPEFFGWLTEIVKNESRRAARDETRQKRDVRRECSLNKGENESRVFGGLSDDQLTPQSSAIAQERIELFHKALARLSHDHALAIQLRSLDQLSWIGVAEKMGRTVESARKIWLRAIGKFEKELEQLNEQSRQQ